MALLESLNNVVKKCPKCGSNNVRVEYVKLDTSKKSLITRKYTTCNSCGYKG